MRFLDGRLNLKLEKLAEALNPKSTLEAY